ncbi:MAG: DUF5916 domain-containing protein [Gemmatimonadota bacterium]
MRPMVVAAATLIGLTAAARAQELEARRAQTAPVVDGRADEAVWRDAPVASAFTVFRPTEGGTPTYKTEVRVVYDARTLFVLVRAFDPHPDSIVGVLTRRDNVGPPSDVIQLDLDTYHDGRNGYEYVVNPAGVKSDFLIFDDDRLDLSWDGIWDVGTSVDSLGWAAEYAIPFAQMRFRGRASVASTFGIMVTRVIGRTGERSSWPRYSPSQSGFVSQFTQLTGLDDLPGGIRLEAAPYLLVRVHNAPATPGVVTASITGGADFKFGPLPNVTVDATINPDFGQVESDPAVLNLSSIETFLPERRPFFLEGAGLFRFSMSRDPNSPEGLFYTRRIGRSPSLAGYYSGINAPAETNILGAAKLTSRLGGRTSLASLAAVTGEERGDIAGVVRVVEPRTAYSITRVQRDFRRGRSGVGLMLTGVARALDSASGSLLSRQAVTGGLATNHLSDNGQWLTRMWLTGSRLEGTPAAMTRVQLSQIHAFQRPDDGRDVDSTATALSGLGGQIFLGKVGGVVRFGSSYRHFTPGFNPTDAGYTRQSDHRSLTQDVGLVSRGASSWFRTAAISMFHITFWSGSGRIEDMIVVNGNVELPSQWTVFLNSSTSKLFGAVCSQECTRGGPALRKDPAQEAAITLLGDARRALQPEFGVGFSRGDAGRSSGWRVQPGLLWRPASNLQVGMSTALENLKQDAQFYGVYGDVRSDTAHYTVARLEQATRSLTTRISYAATPNVSVQWYAQPFIARGTYSSVRELNQPRSSDYALRFKSYFDTAVSSAPGGTNFRQFRSNLVTRWEYRPGSVLFVVWTQGRDLSNGQPGTLNLGRDARDLFALAPRNTIAVKASYWFGR